MEVKSRRGTHIDRQKKMRLPPVRCGVHVWCMLVRGCARVYIRQGVCVCVLCDGGKGVFYGARRVLGMQGAPAAVLAA